MTQADLEVVYSSSGLAQMIAEQRQLNAQMQQLVQQSTAAARSVDNFGNEAQSSGQKIGGLTGAVNGLGGMLAAAGLAVGAAEIIGLGKSAVQSAINYETLNVQFEVFLGSAEKAKTVLADLNKFSIETPFTPDEVNASGRALLGLGISAEDLIPSLKLVGNLAAGMKLPFEELAVTFGKAMSAGVVQNDMLNMFNDKGIPILKKLGEMYNTDVIGVKKMAEQNKISSEDFKKAIASFSESGGIFEGMMDKMSKSTEGLLSTIEGKLQDELRAIGQAMLPTIRVIAEGFEPAFAALKSAIMAVYGPFADVLKALGSIVGAFKLGGTQGNAFANIVTTLTNVWKVASIPMRLILTLWSKIFGAIGSVIGGIRDYIAASPKLMAVVNALLTPFRMLGDAISWVSEALGLSEKAFEVNMAPYKQAVAMITDMGKHYGATAQEMRDFGKQIDLSKLQGLGAADALKEIDRQLVEFLAKSAAARKKAEDLAKSMGDLKNGTGPAAGSIAALEAQLKALNERFTATGSELERSQLRQKIDAVTLSLKRMKDGIGELDYLKSKDILGALGMSEAVTDMEKVTMEAQKMHEALLDVSQLGQRETDGGSLFPDGFVEEIDAKTKAITDLKIAMYDLTKTVGTQLKDAFLQFGVAASEAIGRAIAMGENVGDVFKKVLVDFLVNVPKLVGMALLNAAAGMIGQPAAIPIAAAGLALIGMSALLSGARDKKEMQKQNEVGGIASAPSPSNGRVAAPEGLAQAATAGQMVVLNLDIDGKKFAQATFGATSDERRKRIF